MFVVVFALDVLSIEANKTKIRIRFSCTAQMGDASLNLVSIFHHSVLKGQKHP